MPPSINSMTESKPTSSLGADATKGFAQAGQVFSQGLTAKPAAAVPTPAGDDSNKSGPGGDTNSGFPAAGEGKGGGLVSKPGAIGQTKARPRTPFSQGGFGAGIPRK